MISLLTIFSAMTMVVERTAKDPLARSDHGVVLVSSGLRAPLSCVTTETVGPVGQHAHPGWLSWALVGQICIMVMSATMASKTWNVLTAAVEHIAVIVAAK